MTKYRSIAGLRIRHYEKLSMSILVTSLLALSGAGCSSDTGATAGGGTGGGIGTGGKMGTGGQMVTGGQTGTGGQTSNGGQIASGGQSSAGGQTNSGGQSVVNGGQPSAGGQPTTGGQTINGGQTSNGGNGGAPTSDAGSTVVRDSGASQPDGRVGDARTGAGGSTSTGGVISAGGGTSTGGASSTGGSTYMPCPTNGTACQIMPLGDSITQGTTYAGSYRVQLFHLALADSKNITFVGSSTPNGPTTVDNVTFPRNHEGHSGYLIKLQTGWSGLNPKVTDVIKSNGYQPHIITLMIGTNDMNGSVDVANAPTRLGDLIDVLAGICPKALIVVAQITPTKTAATNTRIAAYNAAIPAMLEKHAAAGQHVALIDMNTPFTSNASYQTAWMYDDLHPNQAGFTVMGNAWYAAIKNLLPAK